jgi:hypothetical protein
MLLIIVAVPLAESLEDLRMDVLEIGMIQGCDCHDRRV